MCLILNYYLPIGRANEVERSETNGMIVFHLLFAAARPFRNN